MAYKKPSKGEPPLGLGGDTFETGAIKLFDNTAELFTKLGANVDGDGVLPDAIPLEVGGTGATTAAEARTNLGLGTAATKNVGTASGTVMQVGAFGLGGSSAMSSSLTADRAGGFTSWLDNDSGDNTGVPAYQMALNIPWLDLTHSFQLLAGLSNSNYLGYRRWRLNTGFGSYQKIRTSENTTVDGNGFIKAASPIVKLFADKIELNDEAKLQEITFDKLGVGDYLIKNSSGLSDDGWYIEQPKDSNGNIFHAIEYGTHASGDIWLKTYEQMMDGTRVVADHSKPVDIKESRFISIRLNELPKDNAAPQNPTIVDSEGNAAPTRYHTLEEGVWVISDENVAILEKERLSAMKPLKRRQFRLALAMSGYDLAEIESLINQIEDPMQRTIAQIEWQDATDFERTNPTLLMMAQLLGLSSEDVDSLWEYGLAL